MQNISRIRLVAYELVWHILILYICIYDIYYELLVNLTYTPEDRPPP